MRVLIFLAAASLTLGAARANEYALTRAGALYEQLSDDSQCEAALPAAREFWRSRDFSTLPEMAQGLLLQRIMGCAWALEDAEGAIAASRAAQAAGADWPGYALLQIGVRFQTDGLALESFHALDASDPDLVSRLPARFVWGVLGAARRADPSGAASLRVHDVLAQRRYAAPEGGPDDALRVEHARLLASAGRIEQARTRLDTVLEPRHLMLVRIDRAFDGLRGEAGFERRLDLVAAAEANVARAEAAIAAAPRKLSRVLDAAQALRMLWRNDEALALLDRHLAAAQGADAARSYDDVADNLNWLLNERAYILYDLNRPDEARAAFGLSIAVGEHGGWSVSQVINFASMLEAEGRGADALEVLRTVGRASPYGDMWVAAVRVCAAEQQGDAALVGEAMRFLRAHVDDNVSAAARAYLCVNDLDAAAALYVRRRQDLEMRGDALLALQTHREAPSGALPRLAVLRQRLDQVRSRADVRAAVEAVGRIEESPLHSVYWGDL